MRKREREQEEAGGTLGGCTRRAGSYSTANVPGIPPDCLVSMPVSNGGLGVVLELRQSNVSSLGSSQCVFL